MTKKDLYDELNNREIEYGVNSQDIQELLSEFFDSHVYIPKGDNRHPYADVIHAFAEGINNIEVLRSEGWVEFKQSGMCLCIGDEYRIKTSEPQYEWQWYRKVDWKVIDWSETFRTEQETQVRFDKPKEWYKFEETKRERK